LLNHILPASSFGGGNCPSTFITDDLDAERNALHSTWHSVRRRRKNTTGRREGERVVVEKK